MLIFYFWHLLLAGYLLGSIPSAKVASRLAVGKHVRELGDHKMDTLNTFNTVGRLPAVFVVAPQERHDSTLR